MIALVVFYEQGQVIPRLRSTTLNTTIRYKVNLAAKNWRDNARRFICLHLGNIVRFIPNGHILVPLSVHLLMARRIRSISRRLGVIPFLFKTLNVVLPLFHIGSRIVVAATRQVKVGHTKHILVIGKGKCGHVTLNSSFYHTLYGCCSI